MNINWRTLSLSEVEQRLGTSVHDGLSSDEAKKRLETYGPNDLPAGKPENAFVIFLQQFRSPLIYVLLAASIVVFITGEATDGLIIIFVLVFNAVIGAIQEGKAQSTLRALKKFSESYGTVIRGGEEIIIPDRGIVPGDIIVLRAGEKIPADGRIVEAATLRLDESALTGESVPVHKEAIVMPDPNLSQENQRNMVFKGTNVVSGSGRAIVVATGLETAIGKISQAVAAIDTEIPLKKDIRSLARAILFTTLAISIVLFAVGVYSGRSVGEMFRTVVALAVSIIPEGLPLVLTLVLAMGVWRMAKRNALVKKLQAVEALGQAKVIAVDKTGTITRNELVIKEVFVDGKKFTIGGVGYEPKGEVRFGENVIDPVNHEELVLAGKIAAFCADGKAVFSEEAKIWRVAGDPTEAAMAVFAEKIGFHKSDLERELPLVYELPFDYKTKYHMTVHSDGSREFVAVAGMPETVIELSEKILSGGEAVHFTREKRAEAMSVLRAMSSRGLRVVAFAFLDGIKTHNHRAAHGPDFKGLTFAGFYGMMDSLKPEVPEAVLKARDVGMKVVMITGDHKLTALNIAKEAGIWREGDKVLTGEDLATLSDEALAQEVADVSVFARVTPEDKMKIIKAFRHRGEIVAMTGDGVNDAPSLVAADLGVAMGKIGTDVAKEAADIVLLDDNFGSIVSAVEEGRHMYKTIQKSVLFLISTSIGEVLTIAGAVFAGLPLPLLPAQIIWLNLVTDPFMGLALALEPKESGLLRGEFSRPKKGVIDELMAKRFFVMALPMMFGAFYLFGQYFESDIVKAQTIALTALAVFQWLNAWNCRSERNSIFGRDMFSNKFLVLATIGIVPIQIAAVYWGPLQAILGTTALTLGEWGWIALVAFSIIVAEEARKAHTWYASVEKAENAVL